MTQGLEALVSARCTPKGVWILPACTLAPPLSPPPSMETCMTIGGLVVPPRPPQITACSIVVPPGGDDGHDPGGQHQNILFGREAPKAVVWTLAKVHKRKWGFCDPLL